MKNKRIISILALLAVLIASIFATQLTKRERDGLYFYQIDVGQGDSALFIFPNGETMLLDSGPRKSAAALARFLREQDVEKIDLLVATHPHSDHIGGMERIINDFEIGKVWDSGFVTASPYLKTFYKMIKSKNIPFGRPKRGYREHFGGGMIEVLAPLREIRGTGSDPNNNCIVLRVTYGDVSFLMTGDMEEEERHSISPLPHAEILKISHHGSHNGTDIKMLREVSPRIAVISYERGNSYGFPHREVVRDIRSMNLLRFDTAHGTVEIRTDGKRIRYSGERVLK